MKSRSEGLAVPDWQLPGKLQPADKSVVVKWADRH